MFASRTASTLLFLVLCALAHLPGSSSLTRDNSLEAMAGEEDRRINELYSTADGFEDEMESDERELAATTTKKFFYKKTTKSPYKKPTKSHYKKPTKSHYKKTKKPTKRKSKKPTKKISQKITKCPYSPPTGYGKPICGKKLKCNYDEDYCSCGKSYYKTQCKCNKHKQLKCSSVSKSKECSKLCKAKAQPKTYYNPYPKYHKKGSISGSVKKDTDNNDTGDMALSGIKIVLKTSEGHELYTTKTDEHGNYAFYDVPAGHYIVMEMNTDPAFLDVSDSDGGDPDSIAVNIGDGYPLDSEHNDFVDERKKTIMGQVKEDTNNDGKGEKGISHAVIKLLDSTGKTVLATTKTDTHGNFAFIGLEPGLYKLMQNQIPGFFDVTDSDGGDPNMIHVDVSSEDSLANMFIDEAEKTISGQVKEDTDNDDVGEKGIAHAVVKLLDSAGKKVLATTKTDTHGNFSFEGLEPGTYKLMQNKIPGFFDVKDSDGSNPNMIHVDVSSADSSGNMFIDEKEKTISGQVKEDTDNDDKPDAGVPGVTVTIFDSDGKAVATTVTDKNGDYSFSGLKPGKYTLKQTNLDGFIDLFDSDGGDPNVISVDVGSGDVTTTFFADERVRMVKGIVKEDVDSDGIGEKGICHILVNLVDELGRVVSTTKTDAQGGFIFLGVEPGTYSVVEVTPSDLVDVADSDGGDPNVVTIGVSALGAIPFVTFIDKKPKEGDCTFTYEVVLQFEAPEFITLSTYAATNSSTGDCASEMKGEIKKYAFMLGGDYSYTKVTSTDIAKAYDKKYVGGLIALSGYPLPDGVTVSVLPDTYDPASFVRAIENKPPHYKFIKAINISANNEITCSCTTSDFVSTDWFNLKLDYDAETGYLTQNSDSYHKSYDEKTWTFKWEKKLTCVKPKHRFLRA